MNDVHHFFLTHLTCILNKTKGKQYGLSEFVDLGFLCRESENLLDDWRKDCKARKELIGKIIAFEVTKSSLNDPNMNETIHGTLATGTPDVKIWAALPKKNTPEYQAVLDFFYVPRRSIDEGILKLDWNKVKELVTTLAQEGKTLPPGIGKTYPEYSTVFRKKKGKSDDKDTR